MGRERAATGGKEAVSCSHTRGPAGPRPIPYFDDSWKISAATKKLSKFVHDFTETMYQETGARFVVLGSFVGTSGQKQIAWYVDGASRAGTLSYFVKL